MNAWGSDFLSNLGKSIFWNRGGRSLWCSPVDGPEDALEFGPCCITSTFYWMSSTLVDNARMRTASFDMEGSAMVVAGEGVGGGGVGCVVDVVDEERLDRDTKLSWASMPKTATPRLRSS